jgi:hypothetical protein
MEPRTPSTAFRARASLLGIRCVYVRRVKPGSECPRYSASAPYFVLVCSVWSQFAEQSLMFTS